MKTILEKMAKEEQVTVCMGHIDLEGAIVKCGDIQIEEDKWVTDTINISDYKYLSHGLCPKCYNAYMSIMDREEGENVQNNRYQK